VIDVLLINPAFSKEEEKKHFPTGLGMIGGALKRSRIPYTVFDCDTAGIPDNSEIFRRIELLIAEKKPKIVGLTGCWIQYPFLKELSLSIKNKFKDLKIVGGGYWAFQAPEVVLSKTGTDYIIHGEGDEVFPEVVKHVLADSDTSSLEGISSKGKDGITVYNGPNLYVKNLDTLAFPDYEKFEMDYYISRLSRKYLLSKTFLTKTELDSRFGGTDPLRNITINSARGCIGRCAFCSAAVQHYRRFSTKYIIKYIKYLKDKYDISSVNFSDSLTFVNKRQTEEFCNAALDARLNIIFHIIVRTDIDYTQDTIRLLKQAGCYDLVFGMESANEEICNTIMGKRINVDRAGDLFDLCRKEKLHTRVTFIFNMPGETEQAAWDTIEFIRRHRLERGGVYYANPLPKTRLYEIAKSRGHITDDVYYYEFNPGLDKGVSDFKRYIDSFKFNNIPDCLVEGYSHIARSYYSINYYENHRRRLTPRYVKAWGRLYYNLTKYYLYKIACRFFRKSKFLAHLRF
jgi:radical SAM superfamily enzyme YgiQ (UPF0313 family)